MASSSSEKIPEVAPVLNTTKKPKTPKQKKKVTAQSGSSYYYKNLHLPSETEQIFNIHVSLAQPLLDYQVNMLNNIWTNRFDTKSLVNTLNCMAICFEGYNTSQNFMKSRLESYQTDERFSTTSLVPKTPHMELKATLAQQENKIQELITTLEKEKEKYELLLQKHDNLLSDNKYLTNICDDVMRDNLLKSHQYIYYPELDSLVKQKIFRYALSAKEDEMVTLQNVIINKYLEHDLTEGISYIHIRVLNTKIVKISLDLHKHLQFYNYPLVKLVEYGFVAKTIIRRTHTLPNQIMAFKNPDLEDILFRLFEDNDMINEIILIFKSIIPTYQGLADGVKHIIELHTCSGTKQAFQVECHIEQDTEEIQKEDLYEYRRTQISHLINGFSRPRFMNLIFMSKNMIIFTHEKNIRGNNFFFKFYEDSPNLLEKVKAEHRQLKITGDQHPSARFEPLSESEPQEPYPDDDMAHQDWLDQFDDIGLHNLENQMES